jgi:hypothetical protein
MSQMPGHAAKRSDPDAARQQHCGASSMVGKREIPERPCHPGPGSERRRGEDAFEGGIPQGPTTSRLRNVTAYQTSVMATLR